MRSTNKGDYATEGRVARRGSSPKEGRKMVSLAGARGEAVLALLAFAGPLPVNASQKVALPNGEVLNFGAKSGHKHKQLDWPINGRPVTEKDLADKRIC